MVYYFRFYFFVSPGQSLSEGFPMLGVRRFHILLLIFSTSCVYDKCSWCRNISETREC